MATTKRGSSNHNWHHHQHLQPPFPAPKILHLPHRPGCSRPPSAPAAATKNTAVTKQVHPHKARPPCVRLEALFEQERAFTSERKAASSSTTSPGSSSSPSQSPAFHTCRGPTVDSRDSEVEKWRFESEVLRAECNFLRREREVTGKKQERSRERVDAVLQSAIKVVVSARRKVDGNKKVETALEELQSKLECMRKSIGVSRHEGRRGSKDRALQFGLGSCTRNFDKKALVLRRRLQEINVREMMPESRIRDGGGEGEEEEVCVREIREIESETTGGRSSRDEKPSTGGEPDDRCKSKTPDVEALRRKMEIISMGMLERMEEYGSILSSSSCTSTSGAATVVSSSAKQVRNDKLKAENERTLWPQQLDESGGDLEGGDRCSGMCRDVVGRIVEQVRAETEQWAEMQAMLEQVREEMDDLRRSRDFWERRAAQTDQKIRSMNAQVADLRQRAEAAEGKAAELEDAAARYGDLLRAWGTAASAKPLGDDGGVDLRGSRAMDDKSSLPRQMHKGIQKTGLLLHRLIDENAMPPQRAAYANRRPPLREIQISQQ